MKRGTIAAYLEAVLTIGLHMPKTLVLFPDTNIFMQCEPLHTLDWRPWNGFDEIRLIICRVVQAEIDKHKNRGGDRLAKRARTTSTMIRNLIKRTGMCEVIRESKPKVTLELNVSLSPGADMPNTLDWHQPDDWLVATALTFSRTNPDLDVRVLTDDTGPMVSAHTAGLQIAEVPDGWLLKPEKSVREKEISALKAEIAQLKGQEPRIEIECRSEGGTTLTEITADLHRFSALSKEQVEELINLLRELRPIETDFGAKEPRERSDFRSLAMFGKEIFTPSTEEQIAAYQGKYERWIDTCKERLTNYDAYLQHAQAVPHILFWLKNTGSRPAKNALVEIKAYGQFKIAPPGTEDDHDGKDLTKGQSYIPSPPTAPKGSWKFKQTHYSALHDALGRGHMPGYESIARPQDDFATIAGLHRELNTPRDANAFYYKPTRPSEPEASFTLECMQWRHGAEEEGFDCKLFFALEANRKEITGLLQCEVHAENLSSPKSLRIPVRGAVTAVSAYDAAKNEIEKFRSSLSLFLRKQ